MMHSGLLRILGWISWIITALASINIGLAGAFGWDLFNQPWFSTNFAWLLGPASWIIGIAGVYSLVLFFLMLSCGCGKCGTSDCKCK